MSTTCKDKRMERWCIFVWPDVLSPTDSQHQEEHWKTKSRYLTKLVDQIYESFHCLNWMCIAWCVLVLFKSRALLWYAHESCWKKKFWTSSSPCDRHLILLWDKPAQTHQLAGIYAVEWDHYQHRLPLHIPCLLMENTEEKAWPSIKCRYVW